MLPQAVLFLGVYPKHIARGSVVRWEGKEQGSAAQAHPHCWVDELSRDSVQGPLQSWEAEVSLVLGGEGGSYSVDGIVVCSRQVTYSV